MRIFFTYYFVIMLSLDFIRSNTEKLKKVIASGRSDPKRADVDKWLKLDKQRKMLLQKLEDLNKQKKDLAKNIQTGENIDAIRLKGKQLKMDAHGVEKKLKDISKQWQEIMNWFPNIPINDSAMPPGESEKDNVVLKAWIPEKGYIDEANLKGPFENSSLMPDFPIHAESSEFKPKHHLQLGETLNIIDNKQAAKVSGTRFTYLLGDLVLLQNALHQYFLKMLIVKGFKPIIPPLLVKHRSLYGTSHFPEGKDQVYKIESDYVEDNQELYLVGSSEPTNFSYFMDKVLDTKDLPVKIFAYTPCFRSEAGSWGKDTKGIKRMHQFDKIEMNVVCKPDQSDKMFNELAAINEALLQKLEIPYQIVLKCTGDAGYHASAKQIDPEAWLSGQKEFMEVMTATNATDFQARRLNIKYTTEEGKKEFVHTLNDTGIAMGRMLIAIMDNYQQADGTIKVPEVLQEYMGKKYIC